MRFNETLFLERYNKLNAQQKEAVNTVYGPVMVIAGPGTGKTEVLSMRIANLLRSDAQVKPYEILCLTFTDEGTVAMRRRLLQIIGEDAHKVHIYTFHAFCNSIIQSNPDYFGLRELMPVSDLERMDMVYEIIKELPEGHLLRRLAFLRAVLSCRPRLTQRHPPFGFPTVRGTRCGRDDLPNNLQAP